MRLIRQGYTILTPIDADQIMCRLEESTRLCYKSEDKIGPGTAEVLVKSIIRRGHHAMLEHVGMTIRFVTNRGVTHEMVRHRIASFAQESTRYCNYSKGKFGGECTFIIPCWFPDLKEPYTIENTTPRANNWLAAMLGAEHNYFQDLELGAKAQEAREILPNSLKTEIDVTANMREWRHILTLRTDKAAHPQMRDLMAPLLAELKRELPVLFGDIGKQS